MSTCIETSYTANLLQFIKGNQGLLSQILTATVSATIIGFSLKKLHKIGFFSQTDDKHVKWKRVGKVEKLSLYPLKGAKGLDVDTGYFGVMGMISNDGLHDRSFVLVDEKKYVTIFWFYIYMVLGYVQVLIISITLTKLQ